MLQYNIFHKCHYKNYEDDTNLKQLLNEEGFKREDRYFLEKKFYQFDLLQIFQVESDDNFQESIVNPIIEELFEIVKEHEGLMKCMKHLGGDDLVMGLMILFSTDYLYLAHPCFCEYLQGKTIDNETFTLLETAVFGKV